MAIMKVFVGVVLVGVAAVAQAVPTSYYIYSNGEYESFAQRGHDFDSFHNYGGVTTYLRGNEISFGNTNSYQQIAPAHAGTPAFSVSDIADVLWSGSTAAEVRFNGSDEIWHIYSNGQYESSTQRGANWDSFHNYDGVTTYLRGNEISFGNTNSYQQIAPAHAGTPVFSVSDIADVLWSGSTAAEVRFNGSDEIWHIYNNGEYESSTQRGANWDAFYNYGGPTTYTRGDEISFGDIFSYRQITPRHPGSETFTVSDIRNVVWAGDGSIVVNFVPEPAGLAVMLALAAPAVLSRSRVPRSRA